MSISTRCITRFLVVVALLFLSSTSTPAQVPGLTGQVAFISDRDGNWNVWAIDLRTGDVRRVTNFPQEAQFASLEYPEWSNDGKQLLFAGNAGIWRQYVINADGEGFRELPTSGRTEYAHWDPADNNYIFYHEEWGWGTGRYHRLNLSPPYDDQVIEKSPDFHDNGSSGDEGFDVTTDGLRILTSRDVNYQHSYLVYQDWFGAEVPIATCGEAYPPCLFDRLPGRTHMGRINRQDGWVIYFQAPGFPGFPPINLMKTNADGSAGQVPLTDGHAGEIYEWPSWTKGGNEGYILFDSNRSGNKEIYAMPAVLGAFPDGMINLTNHPATDWFPDYTPTKWDTTPPVIAATVTGTLGLNNWYTSDVTVSWSVTDPESDVTSQSGCTAVSVTSDTSGLSLTCEAASTGGTASETVTIKRDTVPPTVTCSASPEVLSPPNHALWPAIATAVAEDAWSATNLVSLEVVSNEPDSGTGNGDLPDDIQGFPQGMTSAGLLRAERLGPGAGRKYSFTFTVADQAGNAAGCVTFASVPHDKGR